MAWIDRIDRTVGYGLAAARWLVLPVALLLFLQWPLREFVRAGSREANDLGQWIFALYVGLAVTFATRERAHLAVDAIAHDYPARVRDAIGRWGALLCVAPWSLFMLWATWPIVQRSVRGLEKFPETTNFGYFLIKVAAALLALLALVQALLDLRKRN
ncbi:MAG: TRAP transporter small permease subunit [Reyranella sp.]|uniref:TRAP transporter small permease subunit n=1 Tax=Reyranella sp. TaxID=1929291 RepID=UPI001AC1DF05|nr:TRAP transporter small permease subunit [Reyranella sp.]MBN9087698.1 TRAP transporter small permease subunit [Reyranella sp.]